MEIGGGSRVGGGGVKLEQHNLRDLLRMKEDDHRNNLNHSSSSNGGGGGGGGSSSGLTLLALFNEKCEPLPPVDEPLRRVSNSSRTLYDIIREDQMSGYGGDRSDGGRSWRQLRDRIRGRQGGRIPSWSTAVPIPDSDSPFNNQHRNRTAVTRRLSDRLDSIANSAESIQPVTPRTASDSTNSISHRYPNREMETTSGRFNQTTSPSLNNTSVLENHPHQEESTERGGEAVATANQSRVAEPQPARMSLMALLTENDRQMGLKRSAYVMYEESKNAAAEDEEGGENNCCVCMVRQKGAAFIPCGHTFCRQCSRELWVQRGNCPICNNCILEILDIF